MAESSDQRGNRLFLEGPDAPGLPQSSTTVPRLRSLPQRNPRRSFGEIEERPKPGQHGVRRMMIGEQPRWTGRI